MKPLRLLSLALFLMLLPPALHAAEADGKLRIAVFGGHPDDAEYKTGGTAVKWTRLGHQVKLVSATNGEVGRAVQFAETFEVSEYGRQPTTDELRTSASSGCARRITPGVCAILWTRCE